MIIRHNLQATDQPATSDDELCAALADGSIDALEQLYDRYSHLVYGLARAILGDAQEAEDLTQDVFLSLLNRGGYDAGRGSLGTYLTAVTRSRAIDRLRARKRSSRLLEIWRGADIEEEVVSTTLETVSEEECAASVRAAVAGLPASQRRVLELAYFKGMSQAEIAAALDMPLGTVKTWARNGLYALRNALKQFVE